MNYIYALLNEGEIVYVGRTKNLKRRIQQHKYEKKKTFNNFELLYETNDLKEAKDKEDFFIVINDPFYNKSLNSGGQYFSLKEETKNKSYNISKLLHLVNIYDVKPTFSDKYQDFTIKIILQECEL